MSVTILYFNLSSLYEYIAIFHTILLNRTFGRVQEQGYFIILNLNLFKLGFLKTCIGWFNLFTFYINIIWITYCFFYYRFNTVLKLNIQWALLAFLMLIVLNWTIPMFAFFCFIFSFGNVLIIKLCYYFLRFVSILLLSIMQFKIVWASLPGRWPTHLQRMGKYLFFF